MTADVGIDFLSFGGTKNGLMGAEAIVFFNPSLATYFKYFQKQGRYSSNFPRIFIDSLVGARHAMRFENEIPCRPIASSD